METKKIKYLFPNIIYKIFQNKLKKMAIDHIKKQISKNFK